MSDNVYLYAAGDIRGVTTEMVRGSTPQAARAQCAALGVPAEHVSTWAVRATDGTTEEALKNAEERADEAENKLADERDGNRATEHDLRQDYEQAERQHVKSTRERDAFERQLAEVSVMLDRVVSGRMDPQAALAKIAEIVGPQ